MVSYFQRQICAEAKNPGYYVLHDDNKDTPSSGLSPVPGRQSLLGVPRVRLLTTI